MEAERMTSKGRVVVIGSGAAGSACARRLSSAGWTTTLVERDRWGGTCLWYGCIPKKSLYHIARLVRQAKGAEQFGYHCGDVVVDWQSVLAWKWHAQETWAGDQRAALAARGIELIDGDCRFVSENAVQVGDVRLPFDRAVIATGSAASTPDVPGISMADTSSDALRYSELPGSLVVVGAGFIAMEMAGIFASFGVPVTVVVRGSRILEMLDPDLAAVAHNRLGRLGVRFVTGASLAAIEGIPGAPTARVTSSDGRDATIEAEHILLATGRVPQVAHLGLEAAGIALDDRGRLVLDAHFRTTNPTVYAAGDAAGGEMHTPVANYEGTMVAEAVDSGEPARADCSDVPIACFTYPELATVGLTEVRARELGISSDTVRLGFDGIGAGVIEDWRDGFVKLVLDPSSRRILGMQAAGPSASDLIYAGALAIKGGMTTSDLSETLGVHPSFAEALHYLGE